MTKFNQPKIIEAGHFYLSKGPTLWSVVGMEIAQQIAQTHDQLMLMIDDIHPKTDVSETESELPLITHPKPNPDHIVMESDMVPLAHEFLEKLKSLPKRKRARKSKSGKWFSGEFPITDDTGYPLCVLLDAGLTLHKQGLGFNHAVNILPDFYKDQQKKLQRLLAKIMPDFELTTILYDINGQYQTLMAEEKPITHIPPTPVTNGIKTTLLTY